MDADDRYVYACSQYSSDLSREGLADPAHAADGLEHGGLKVVQQETLQTPPQARSQNIVQPDRIARNRLRAKSASGVLGIAAMSR